ncbi:hypothetical protein LINGRAHAP2_LOCUS6668 [Linum grandiflorum]
MEDQFLRREENSPDHQLRSLNDRSVIKEMNGAKRSAETVGCKNASIGEPVTIGLLKRQLYSSKFIFQIKINFVLTNQTLILFFL